jgi:hypothetical protein
LGYAQQVGFVPPLKKIRPKVVVDRSVGERLLEFDSEAQSRANKLPFAVFNPDFEAEVNQVKLLTANNLMKKPDLPKPVLDKSFEFLVKFCEYFGIQSKEIPIGEVQYNPKGSMGHGPSRQFVNKQEFVKMGYLQDEYQIWRHQSHLLNWWVPYQGAGKKEILPLKKIEEKNGRMFMFPHGYHFFSSAQDNQYFNKLLYNNVDWLLAVGAMFQYGGFDSMLHRFFRNCTKFVMGDVRKWDKNIIIYLLRVCRNLRLRVYGGSDKNYYARIRYMYRQDMYIYLILSNGQVIRLFGAQMSGRCNTTADNCIMHLYIIINMLVYHLNPESFYDLLNLIGGCIYSDDNLLGFTVSSSFLAPYAIRAEFYKRFQLSLKEEESCSRHFGWPNFPWC